MSQNVLFNNNQPQQQQYYPVNGGDDLSFQQFSYSNNNQKQQARYNGNQQQYGYGSGSQDLLMGNMQQRVDMSEGVTWESVKLAFSTGGYPDEPPLLEELGINFAHIRTKGLTVMNPFKPIDRHIMDDTDLAGPLIFCFLIGGFLLLSGKLHFGYIYGVAALGCASMYTILNLMSETSIDIYRTASVLGYSLLPMVILSSLSVLFQLQEWVGVLLSIVTVLWCTNSAAAMFVTVLSMNDQRLLVAYPICMFYTAFALLAVF